MLPPLNEVLRDGFKDMTNPEDSITLCKDDITTKPLPRYVADILCSSELWVHTCDLKKENIGFPPIWLISCCDVRKFIYDKDEAESFIEHIKILLFNDVENIVVDLDHEKVYQNVFYQ